MRLVAVVVDYMKAAGVKKPCAIGYNDQLGDEVYGGLEHSAAPDRHKNLQPTSATPVPILR